MTREPAIGINEMLAVQAQQIRTPHRFYKTVRRNGKVMFRVALIGLVKVRISGRQEDLTMVVSRIPGVDKPMMLLTNLPVENASDAKRVMCYCVCRWLPDKPEFLLYRMLRGLMEAINICFWLHKDLLMRPLWKNP